MLAGLFYRPEEPCKPLAKPHFASEFPPFALVMSILVLASGASIMSTDLYTPSLPHLPAYFGTTAQQVQLTVSLNLLGFALAQLVIGPLSDRFGRRPIFLAGLMLFAISSALCASAQSVEQLILARAAQGITASVEAVVGLAVIRDLYNETQRVRAFAIWGMAVAVAPAAAPIIGGYIHVSFGWRANFVLIVLMAAAAAAAVWRFLPESGRQEPNALHPSELARGYGGLLTDRRFLGYSLLLGAGLGGIFAYITIGPFLLIQRYGVATEHFGYYQAIIVAAYFIGSVAANYWADKMSLDRLLWSGVSLSLVGAAILPFLVSGPNEGPLGLAGGMAIIALGLGPVFAVAPNHALAHITQKNGRSVCAPWCH